MSSTEPTVKRLTKEQAALVKQMEQICRLSPWSVEDYISEIQNENSVCLIIEKNSRGVGFLISRLITSDYNSPINQNEANICEIYNIAIMPEYRKQKLGTILLKNLYKICHENNIDEIWLEVRKQNTGALIFYERHHFESVYERKNYYSNPVDAAIVMRRKLKNDPD